MLDGSASGHARPLALFPRRTAFDPEGFHRVAAWRWSDRSLEQGRAAARDAAALDALGVACGGGGDTTSGHPDTAMARRVTHP